jgi:hypothetical protein
LKHVKQAVAKAKRIVKKGERGWASELVRLTPKPYTLNLCPES